MYDGTIRSNIPSHDPHINVTLNEDEQNIIRYAAGYIPFKLLKKYEKSFSDLAISAVECLSTMAINGDESSLLEYTRSWTLQINRGALFENNDLSYELFKEIEMNVQHYLLTVFQKGYEKKQRNYY